MTLMRRLDPLGGSLMLSAMLYPSRTPANVVAPKNWHFQYLADHLRADEKSHWLAFSGADVFDADVAAQAYMMTPGLAFTLLGSDGMPAVAGGFREVRKGAWEGWMVGTAEGWDRHWRGITRATRWLMGQLFVMGARRLSIDTVATRVDATDWYGRALGMRLEGVQRRAGAHGEDIVTYSRIAEDDQA